MNLTGYKTYITGVVAIVTSIGAHLTGDLELASALHIVLDSLLGMFIRNGIATSISK